jgi:DNA-binding transcriptional regulator YiaG
MAPEPLTPDEFKAWRARLGMTQEGLAHELGVTFTTVWRWEHGNRPIAPMVRLALAEVERQREAKRR